jgi:hypothetical protein
MVNRTYQTQLTADGRYDPRWPTGTLFTDHDYDPRTMEHICSVNVPNYPIVTLRFSEFERLTGAQIFEYLYQSWQSIDIREQHLQRGHW